MAVYPTRVADKLVLAGDLVAGMKANPQLFKGCPVTADQLAASVAKLRAAEGKKIEMKAKGVSATAEQRKAEKEMDGFLKQSIRHAENIAQGDAGQLESLGWGGPRKRGRRPGSSQVPPGQVHLLEIVEEGSDSVTLRWKAPKKGGKAAVYEVQRKQGDGDWILAGGTTECAVKLENQPKGVAFLYQVVAKNKAGEGTPSNVVRVVL